ncbi:MAG: PPC domain-containing protein [Microcystaceae cyanobacterium]
METTLNSLSQARNIGTLNGSRSYQDWVGSGDTNDYYRFNVNGRTDFSLDLTGLSSDADVRLLDSSGNDIRSSTNSGSRSESINRDLATGTYYVRVYPHSGNTNYNLALNAQYTLYNSPVNVDDSEWQNLLQNRNDDFNSLSALNYKLKLKLKSTELAFWGLVGLWSSQGKDDASELLSHYLNENNNAENHRIDLDEAIQESTAYRDNILSSKIQSALSRIRQVVRSGYYAGRINNNWDTQEGDDWGNDNWKFAVGGHHLRYVTNYYYYPNTDIVTIDAQFFLKDVYDFAGFNTELPIIIDVIPHALHLVGSARAYEVSGASTLYQWQYRLSDGALIRDGFTGLG